MNNLDTRLLAAHEADDTQALVSLYTMAADQSGTEQAKGFYLTHAYIFALELGDPVAPVLRQRLIDMGRETPL